MSTALIQHAFHGQAIRVVLDEHGEPWFVAKDVTAVLGITNGRDALSRVDSDGVGTADVIDSLGRTQAASTVNEGGLYELIFQSRRPEAREFRRWVTTEVLPSIRRTGHYGPADVAQITRSDLARWVIEAEARAEKAEAAVAILEPPARAWQTLAEATGDYSLRDAAQILDRDESIKTGQNRLAQYLRQIGWLDKTGTPYQRVVEVGYVRSRARTYRHHRTGEEMVAEPQVRITGKGLSWLHKHLGGTEPLDAELPALPLEVVR